MRLRMVRFLALIMLLALAAGCGPNQATVSGKVVYQNKPVTSGTVNFLAKSGDAAQATLGADGTFKLADMIPTGSYSVFVAPEPPTPPAPGTRPTPRPPFLAPKRALDPVTSGVQVTLQGGKNDLSIELKD